MISIKNFVRQRKITFGIIISIILISLATITAFAATAKTVYIHCDDSITQIRTIKSDPKDILNQAGTIIGNDDYVDLSAFSNEGSKITVYRACNVTVNNDGESSKVKAIKDVDLTLKSNNITLGKFDFINCSLDDPVYEGMNINIEKAFSVVIIADGEEKDIEISPNSTVSNAIELAGLTLSEDDNVNPSPDTELQAGMTIEVLRVEYKERTETQTVEYKTVAKKSSNIYVGQSKVTQQGKNGEKEVLFSDKYVNGGLECSVVVKETITKPCVNKIKVVGTLGNVELKSGLTPISTLKVPSSVKIDDNGKPTKYKNAIVAKSFAYSCGTTTSTGKKAQPGYIAVNPKEIPYGTEMWIVSKDGKYVYGYAIAADTGGFAKKHKNTVDLRMNSSSECNKWGRRDVVIYFL
ncbi:MAG TPA: G5 domain-containing protein [Clostridia bacterium]|nr:G5 domain-containing protein [Clostridia bacterium]